MEMATIFLYYSTFNLLSHLI